MAAMTGVNLAETPALMPPPGVIPNFVDPPSLQGVTDATIAICLILATVFVAVRLVTNGMIDRALQWEDWCCCVAWLGTIGFAGVILQAASEGVGRHQWDVDLINAVKVAKNSNVGSIIYGPIIFFAKLAILLQYLRIFVAIKRNAVFWGCHMLIWSNLIFYLVETLVEIFACTPREKIWNPTIPGRCIAISANYNAVAAWNILSDFSILLLPIIAIWGLNMPIKRKLAVAAVFATGLFACIASIVRLVYTVKLLHTKDTTYAITKVALWNVAELTTILLCACMPIFPKAIMSITDKRRKRMQYQTKDRYAGYRRGGRSRNAQQKIPSSSGPSMDQEDLEGRLADPTADAQSLQKPKLLHEIASVPRLGGSRKDQGTGRSGEIGATRDVAISLHSLTKPEQAALDWDDPRRSNPNAFV